LPLADYKITAPLILLMATLAPTADSVTGLAITGNEGIKYEMQFAGH